jgi:DNA-binding transcriptional ArsR family regulator
LNDWSTLTAEDTTNDEFAPVAERTISDIDELKAISDPVRLRILEAMVAHADETWTVKRIARALDVGPTKLYHHINILEEQGFIRVAGTRVVSGIIETSYRIAQLSIRLDRGLLSAGAVPESVDLLMRTVLDSVLDGIERSLRAGLADPAPDAPAARKVILARGLARVRPERAGELHDRMRALIEEFDALDDGEDAQPFGYIVGLYPIAEVGDAGDDDATGGSSDD